MGSAASTSQRFLADSEPQLPLEEWDVEHLARFLDGEDCFGVAAYARAHAVDGTAALTMDETNLSEIICKTGGAEVSFRLTKLLRNAEGRKHKKDCKDAFGDSDFEDYDYIDDYIGCWERGSGPAPADSSADAFARPNADDDDCRDDDNDVESAPADASTPAASPKADGDCSDDDNDGDDDAHDADRLSTRVVRTQGSVFLMGVTRGAASAVSQLELTSSSSGAFKYDDGFVVEYDGWTFGRVIRRLGEGAMGTVYEFDAQILGQGKVDEPSHVRCACKTIRSNASTTEKIELENSLASEVAMGFACGRAPCIASVVNVLLPQPGIETNARGLMLLCDLIIGGDLEEAMHGGATRPSEKYLGKLYSEEGMRTWPLISLLLQIFKACVHIHSHGIIHQDIKPPNLMLCCNGVVKIADFGLAAFSSKKDVDPWRETEVCGGLCAKLMGGTPEYFCSQQLWLLEEVKTFQDEDARDEFESKWMLTPATSDLYQIGMTMLEAHARYLPLARRDSSALPRDAAVRCAARTPEKQLSNYTPRQLEAWLAEKKIEPQLDGKLVAKGIDGVRLLELAKKSYTYLKSELDLKTGSAKRLQNSIRHSVSALADEIAHPKAGEVLVKCLNPAVSERFATAFEVLNEGLGAKADFDPTNGMTVLSEDWFTTIVVGCDLLPSLAKVKPNRETDRHSDDVVDRTLSGLTKRLVEYGDVQGALTTCSEWVGVASPEARLGAVSVYLKLWRDFGSEVHSLDLSRATHGHWCDNMLSAEGVMRSLATSLSTSAAAGLERIDLSEQRELEAGVLEVLLGACALPKLRAIKLAHCQSATGECGSIPATIGGCEALELLDLTNSSFTGCVNVIVGGFAYVVFPR